MFRGAKGKRSTVSVTAVIISACLAGACRGSSQASSTDIWAVVDGRNILREDVEKVYRGTIQNAAAPVSDDEALGRKLQVLDDYINQDILVSRAQTLKLEASDADVETALAEQKRGISDEQFQEGLKQRGLTVDDLKRGIRRDLSAQKVVDQEITSKIAITDEDITAFYNANKASFNVPEQQFRLARILITPTKDPALRNRANNDAGSPAEAKAKFDMLMEKLRGGADFGQLAADYTEDADSVASGGDIGYVSRTELNQQQPILRDLVLKTEPGRVSTATIGQGFVILTVVSREAPGQRELSTPAVRDGIRDILRGRKETLLRTAYITAARNDAKITNYLAKQVVDTHGKLPLK